MIETVAPTSLAELSETVLSMPRLLPVGMGTKPRLSAVDVPKLSTAHLRGMVEYEPDEFTFTALAGTLVKDIAGELAASGQYLPFDTMLCKAGATLGGTVAAGISGPGRFRYGGLRDFILGVRFVDGMGRLMRMGGKVVKNAAGFDLPKFMVGSLGRFGVLGEITFKVFPRPASTLTFRLRADSIGAAMSIITKAGGGRWEFEALDIPPGTTNVLARIAVPEPALNSIAQDVLNAWPGETLTASEADGCWAELASFGWSDPKGTLAKVPVSPDSAVALYETVSKIGSVRMHLSAGGNVAFISFPVEVQKAMIAELGRLRLFGLAIRGDGPLWLGDRRTSTIEHAVKQALDPQNRFPSLND
jgi:glycolate oxidase FAD binding subunit